MSAIGRAVAATVSLRFSCFGGVAAATRLEATRRGFSFAGHRAYVNTPDEMHEIEEASSAQWRLRTRKVST
jgi:hypothetical protein